ncbi:MAG: hypothetical protein JST54_15445 [Deltaproteobacteria bacterium]|nr:hypothetical protein [Deltaproteobacteria bacterium]
MHLLQLVVLAASLAPLPADLKAPEKPSPELLALVDAAKAQGLVSVDPERDGNKQAWCKSGKPAAELPIREPSTLDRIWWPARAGSSKAVRAQVAHLRSAACPNDVFRLELMEVTYESEADAKRALQELRKYTEDHDVESMKFVHAYWRKENRVYDGASGAFMWWDPFLKILKRAGVRELLNQD